MFERTQTVKVRPLSYADVERLARGETLSVYRNYTEGLLATTLIPRRPGGKGSEEFPCGKAVYPVIVKEYANSKNEKRFDTTAEPVGYEVTVAAHMLHGVETGRTLYTTAAAEAAVDEMGHHSRPAASQREQFGVQDDEGAEFATVPLYGSQVSMTLFVKGVDAEEAQQVVEEALREAFLPKTSAVRIHNLRGRPVLDQRVNVKAIDGGPDRYLAVNVLEAEASYYANSGSFQTEAVDASIAIGGE